MPSLARLSGGITCLSFGLLLTEIALTRVFSYVISYHFAYLTIATALLGFASAGSLIAVRPGLLGGAERRLVSGALLAGIATSGCLAFASTVRFDPQAVATSLAAAATLAAYVIVVSVPFFFGGLVVATVLAARPERVGMLYAYDLIGGAVGCALSVPIIWLVGSPAAVAVGAVAMVLSASVFAGRRRGIGSLAITGVIGFGTALFVPFPPSPGKFLSYFLSTPGVRHLHHEWTPLSRVDAVGWDRSATSWQGSYATSGISARFPGRGPEYRMIGYDGGSFAVMYEYDGNPASLDVFRAHVMAAPYQILQEPRTLIIGLGGGADALAGIANDAGPMTGLELNPVTVRLGRREFRDFNGGLFDSSRLEVINTEARHWVEASSERFDLVVLNSIDTLSALSSGAYVLAESYIYTADAFRSYLEQLKPGGLFALYAFDNDGLAGPTNIILRFAATLQKALADLSVSDSASHIVVLASQTNPPLVASLVKREPYAASELAALSAFADRYGFAFWHRPDQAVDHQVARFLSAGEAERGAFLADHYLRLDPATDTSPFFFNFYKWQSLIFPDPADTGTTPATGQKMLLVMLIQAILVSLAAILLPLRWLARTARVRKPVGILAYFSALGLGFILLEIALLQRFVLFLGYPTYSLSVVLFALLLSTGLGSALSTRLRAPLADKPLRLVPFLGLLVAAATYGLPTLLAATLDQPLASRIAIAVALLMPVGATLGMFLPLGLRALEQTDPRLIPWAWAVNGCATVIGTICAVMLAMAYGFPSVMLLAVGIYLAGAIALQRSASA
jgi:SAM-dependent methyltransferase